MPDFLPERVYNVNSFKAIIRKSTNDFEMFCLPREEEIADYIKFNDGETFVDVGANVGAYSLKITSQYKDKAIKVIAIEAHPENYKALRKNIEINNFTNIHAINKVVSDDKGVVTIYERRNLNRVQNDWYTIHETFGGKQLDRRYSLQVESDTLDNILGGYKVDFIKIDIEGAEVKALKGATNTLKQLRKIIIEIHENNFDKVKGILLHHNFEVEAIINKIEKSEGFVIGTKKLHT